MIAVPGDKSCRLVANCEGGPWGELPSANDIVYVDPSAVAAGANGSMSKPFKSIADALVAANDGAIVALAAGNYGPLTLSKRVKLWGRCPSQVGVSSDAGAAVTIKSGIDGVELHRIGISGKTIGITTESATLLDRVWIHDCGQATLANSASVSITGSLFRGNQGGARPSASLAVASSWFEGSGNELYLIGSDTSGAKVTLTGSRMDGGSVNAIRGRLDVSIERTVIAGADTTIGLVLDHAVLDIRQSEIRDLGEGVHLICGMATIEDATFHHTKDSAIVLYGTFNNQHCGASLSLRRASLQHLGDNAVGGAGMDADIESVWIRDCDDSAISFDAHNMPGNCAAKLRGVRIERVRDAAIRTSGCDGSLESARVSDVSQAPGSDVSGFGVAIGDYGAKHAQFTVSALRIERASGFGVVVRGAEVSFDSTAIIDTQSVAGTFGDLGVGLLVARDNALITTRVQIDRSEVIRSRSAGLYSLGAQLDIRRSRVEGTLAYNNKNGQPALGDGVAAQSFLGNATVELRDSLVVDNARAGVAVFAAQGKVAGSVIRCNAVALDFEPVASQEGKLSDGGGNRCGCEQLGPCQAQSSMLTPPGPPF
jgi:hypothetical protein